MLRVNTFIKWLEQTGSRVEPILNKKIDDVNDFIVQELKQRKNWHILTHELSRDDFKKDGLHFNEIGRAKYAHEIRHIVRNLKRK